MGKRKGFQVAFGLVLSCAFIWLILRSIPAGDLLSALATVRADMVAAGVGFFILGYTCRIVRWQLMLRIDNPALPFHRAGVPFMISIAANNVLPLRAGDVMRAFAFSRWLSVPSSGVLATLVSERLLDLLSLLLFLALALAYLGLSADSAAALLGVGSAGLFALAVMVALVFGFPQVFQPVVMFFVLRIAALAGNAGERLTRAMENLFRTLQKVTRSGRTLALIAMSVLAWSAEAIVFYCAALAVPAITEPQAAWLAMPVGTLSTLLPSSPGYLGTFHYFVIEATKLVGNAPAAAAAFAVLVHLILWVTATLIGGICFVYWTVFGIRS
ncbi:flippase-like domain-containing protein [Ruegeria sediminis]|uniref:Flippase-like domain-containing protein n=1 Tax=Ruegeria sediminis TaxID=2583820 RepID=A0ABY2X3R9_9RHOB|nr:lysylphosphatidylglycerol synthase transmembrane domain-containing protein [Ruegeria sediminis]TMV10039.1 flippase-like domain-containing protein [Ruegeria sediminis]